MNNRKYTGITAEQLMAELEEWAADTSPDTRAKKEFICELFPLLRLSQNRVSRLLKRLGKIIQRDYVILRPLEEHLESRLPTTRQEHLRRIADIETRALWQSQGPPSQ